MFSDAISKPPINNVDREIIKNFIRNNIKKVRRQSLSNQMNESHQSEKFSGTKRLKQASNAK